MYANFADKKAYMTEYNRTHKEQIRYRKCRVFAKRRNKEFSLSFHDYVRLILQGCFYCNSSLHQQRGYSLDRKDNSKGYTLDNVVPCCGSCNTMRSDKFTFEEMRVAISAILAYRRMVNAR